MKQSTDRILTTHVGSLARPHSLLDIMKEREFDRPYDAEALDREIADAVKERVRQQVESGIDIVADGEMSKVSFLGYVKDRLGGFEVDKGPSKTGAVVAGRVRHVPRVLHRVLQEVLVGCQPTSQDHLQGSHLVHRPEVAADRHRQPQGGMRGPRCRRHLHAVHRSQRVRQERLLQEPRGVPQRGRGSDARGVSRHRRGRLHPAGRRPVAHRHARRSRRVDREPSTLGNHSRRGAQPRAARHPRGSHPSPHLLRPQPRSAPDRHPAEGPPWSSRSRSTPRRIRSR